MRKVLIIAYYWPPAGGGGVQRWLKFTKYLPEFGWHPIVYVPYNPQYPLRDESLAEEVPPHVEVIRGHIWEARRFYRRLKKIRHGRRWSSPPEMDTLFFRDPKVLSWFGRLSLFLRSNLFVPDSRSLWIRPSFKRLRKWLSENPVDAIISTGPPHSCHLIAMKLKKATGVPWIADFRDPWLEIDYFPQLLLTAATRRTHERLQHAVLTSADKVITVSWAWADLFRNYGAKEVFVITNGYDAPDLMKTAGTPRMQEAFIIASVGTLELDRNPAGLWSALQILISKRPEMRKQIEVHLAGKIDAAIVQEAGEVADLITNFGYVSHQEALTIMKNADLLLLPLNQTDSANARGRIPGKLFEYLAMGKPILMLGNSDSDAGRIVGQLGNSWCVNNDDAQSIFQILDTCISSRGSTAMPVPFDTTRFERRRLTHDLAEVLNSLVAPQG
jgi:glycosyltransferase involved in cell wall biosynthesis